MSQSFDPNASPAVATAPAVDPTPAPAPAVDAPQLPDQSTTVAPASAVDPAPALPSGPQAGSKVYFEVVDHYGDQGRQDHTHAALVVDTYEVDDADGNKVARVKLFDLGRVDRFTDLPASAVRDQA